MTIKGIERTWTDETRDQFIMSFPVRSNKEITSMFGISLYQMQRIARKYGLEKDDAYRRSYLQGNAKRASEALRQRHSYLCTKMSEIKKSLVRRDKLRRAYGLSPLTKYKYADCNATRKKTHVTDCARTVTSLQKEAANATLLLRRSGDPSLKNSTCVSSSLNLKKGMKNLNDRQTATAHNYSTTNFLTLKTTFNSHG